MGSLQSRNSMEDKEGEINTRAGDKRRMKKLDKDIRKTFLFDKDMVAPQRFLCKLVQKTKLLQPR